MNPFIDKIERSEITDLSQLKTHYRKAIKRFHPDISGKDSGDFLLIQKHFHEATQYLLKKAEPSGNAGTADPIDSLSKDEAQRRILDIFVDLLCSNFPQDKKACQKNKKYNARISEINNLTNTLFVNQNLFLNFQDDLYILRKDTVILNHNFNVTVSYLNNIKDYILLRHAHGRRYIENTYELIFDIFKKERLDNGLLFINWLVSVLLGKDAIKGDLPTTR